MNFWKNKRTSRGPVTEQNLQEWQTDKTQWENHWLTHQYYGILDMIRLSMSKSCNYQKPWNLQNSLKSKIVQND